MVFAFFDTSVSIQELNAKASKLMMTQKSRSFRLGKPVFPTITEDSNPSLSDFVGKESWLIFDMLNCDSN